MHCEKAYLIINPREGQDMTNLTAVFTILSAAGWDVDNALVEYGGHAGELAAKAAKHEYDLIIGHGGDGTTNELVNAVMQSKERKSIVGVLPGGTANQWPHEISMPIDPLHAALTLINSDVRHVDVGRITVQSVAFPGATNDGQAPHKRSKDKKHKKEDTIAYYFLLTAGLGIDASVIHHTSKSLKARIGSLAFDVAATKELPEQHSFHIEIEEGDDTPSSKMLWQGDALQVVLGNTRLYGDAVDLTPNAYVDDGLLDICIITADSTVAKLQQLASLALRRKPDSETTTYRQAAHFTMTLPATIGLQIDGSSLELSDCVNDEDRAALKQAKDLAGVMVTYRVDVVPQALPVAIPRNYDNTLFARAPHDTKGHATEIQPIHEGTSQPVTQEHMQALLAESKAVTVMGIMQNPGKHSVSIIAGTTRKESTGDTKPVAVCITTDTKIYQRTGEPVEAATLEDIQAETELFVAGKENKRGVIQATSVIR